MGRTWIVQTKRTFDALKSAGYKRSEVKVWTPCNSHGEYGDAQIMIRASIKRQDELLDAVLATGEIAVIRLDYTSTVYGDKRHTYIYHTTYRERGKLEIRDVDKGIEEAKKIQAEIDSWENEK